MAIENAPEEHRSPIDVASNIDTFRAGFIDTTTLRDRIRAGRFWCEAPEMPGFMAIDGPNGPVIAIHTSERSLLHHAGAVPWFSTSGRDLADLAPPGATFVIDPGARHHLTVTAAALGAADE